VPNNKNIMGVYQWPSLEELAIPGTEMAEASNKLRRLAVPDFTPSGCKTGTAMEVETESVPVALTYLP